MAAFAATFYVTAERCRAAALDSDNSTAARARQRRAVLIAESRAEVEDMSATSSPSRGMAVPSGGRQGGHFGYRGAQGFQRTGRGADLAGGDTQIPGRGVQAAMPEQQLNGP